MQPLWTNLNKSLQEIDLFEEAVLNKWTQFQSSGVKQKMGKGLNSYGMK